MDSETRNKWFVVMDSDERTGFRNVGLLVLGYGAVVTLAVSSFSRPMIMFGLAPAFIGLTMVVFSFVPVPVPKPPPMRGVISLLNLIIALSILFGFHVSRRTARYVGIAYVILLVFLYFWRPAKGRQA